MEWTELVVETTLEASDAVVEILMQNGAGGVQFDDENGNDDLKIITYFPESKPVVELSRDLKQKVLVGRLWLESWQGERFRKDKR